MHTHDRKNEEKVSGKIAKVHNYQTLHLSAKQSHEAALNSIPPSLDID